MTNQDDITALIARAQGWLVDARPPNTNEAIDWVAQLIDALERVNELVRERDEARGALGCIASNEFETLGRCVEHARAVLERINHESHLG